MSDFALYRAVVSFLNREARLLDEGRFEEWLALFCADGIYWIPAVRGQTDARAAPSIVHEGSPLLAMRIERLRHPRAYAALPPPRTLHILGTIDPDPVEESGQCTVDSSLLVLEQQDERQRMFGGACRHVLRRHEGTFRIALKRIDLIDCDATHEPITCIL